MPIPGGAFPAETRSIPSAAAILSPAAAGKPEIPARRVVLSGRQMILATLVMLAAGLALDIAAVWGIAAFRAGM